MGDEPAERMDSEHDGGRQGANDARREGETADAQAAPHAAEPLEPAASSSVVAGRDARPFPHRPRLADHVLPRRHRMDGRDFGLLHDTARDEAVELEPRLLDLALLADGTRDFDGIVLAAAAGGLYRRASEIGGLFADLDRRGMLTSGVAPRPRPRPVETGKPLEVLPDYRFVCDGNGGCCVTYGSIPFGEDEASRALLLASGHLGEGAATAFSPLFGSAGGRHAVALFDGRCAFLADDGRCRVELAAAVLRDASGRSLLAPEGGYAARGKPRGCQTYPATFVDDGFAVRVSLVVECPCVATSLETDGASGGLVPDGARTTSDLLPGTPVVPLSMEIAVAPGRSGSRDALRTWSAAVCAALEPHGQHADCVAQAWSLAEALGAEGLAPGPALAALARPTAPDVTTLDPWLTALAVRAEAKEASVRGWRSTRDRHRRLSEWLAHAAKALRSEAERRLAEPAPTPDAERLYLRALLWGHHLAGPGRTLQSELRDRAVRLLLARQAALSVPAGLADDAAVPIPITAVEAMMRGGGLDSYARGI